MRTVKYIILTTGILVATILATVFASEGLELTQKHKWTTQFPCNGKELEYGPENAYFLCYYYSYDGKILAIEARRLADKKLLYRKTKKKTEKFSPPLKEEDIAAFFKKYDKKSNINIEQTKIETMLKNYSDVKVIKNENIDYYIFSNADKNKLLKTLKELGATHINDNLISNKFNKYEKIKIQKLVKSEKSEKDLDIISYLI